MTKVRIFISYAHRDREFLDRLLKHLAPMQAEGLIEAWTDRAIEAGDRWDDDIGRELARAELILLLVSADFLASKYISSKELVNALEREKRKEAVVIPVILRFADWSNAPFHHLQALPPGARPITDWRNRDEAYLEIARGLRTVVARLQSSSPVATPEPSPAGASKDPVQQDRVLDAAMAARIPLGKPSDLAVMVRRTDSAGLKALLAADDEFTSTPDDVKSKPFAMDFQRDASGKLKPARLTVKIESPDFDPPEQSDDIVVPPDRDSDVCTFLLRPLFPGELVVKLKVFAQDGTNAIRLMRIVSEASDRVVEGGRVLASIPITAMASPAAAAASASAQRTVDVAESAIKAHPAPSVPPPRPPAGVVPRPAPAASAPRPMRKKGWLMASTGAAAALAVIGTVSVIYTGAGGGAAHPPVVGSSPPAAPPESSNADAIALYKQGEVAAASGAYAIAAEKFADADRAAGRNAQLLLRLATANLKLADQVSPNQVSNAQRNQALQLAETAARRAADLQPDSADAHYALGLALQKQHKDDQAVQALTKAVEIAPSNADARLLLAQTLAKRDPASAAKHLQVLEQDSDLSPRNRVAVLHLQNTLRSAR